MDKSRGFRPIDWGSINSFSLSVAEAPSASPALFGEGGDADPCVPYLPLSFLNSLQFLFLSQSFPTDSPQFPHGC